MLSRHINYFLAVAEHGSFTRAASALHVSQPALSQQIRQLEESLGVPLFDRSGRTIRLTDAGEVWRQYASRALQELGAGKRAIHDVANMNHIVVNNYTNAGLSILFLIVVYSIIFYGFKTWLAVRNSDKRTDKETPYVPIPEGGVKISSHH